MNYQYMIELEIDEGKENFQEIEKKVKEQALQGAREITKEILINYEKLWFEKHKSARIKDSKIAKYKTSYGMLREEIKKVKYKGEYFFPVDRWVSVIPFARQTPAFQEVLKDEYVERTFRKGTTNIAERTGVRMGTISGWRSFQQIAEREKYNISIPVRLKNLPLKRLKAETTNPCPILRIEPDETYCRSQPITEKDQEVKIATLYTGKKYVGKKRKKAILLNKTVITSKHGESVDSFIGRVAYVATEIYGANENTVVIVAGDGVSWIPRLKYDYFPQARYFLDWWHVKKKMQLAFGKPMTEKMMEFVYARNPEGLLKFIDSEYFSGCTPELFEAAEEFYTYINNNREGLEFSCINSEFKKLYPGMFKRGSGVIERNVDLVIGERCKLKRMRWSKRGLDNMIFLRENKINKRIHSPIFSMVSPILCGAA